MKTERARILDMLHQGAISVEQAEELLDALQRSYPSETTAAKSDVGYESDARGGRRRNYGQARLTNKSLSRMPLGSNYENYGRVQIADDVDPELLSRKIAGFTNYGHVTGPGNLISILESAGDNYGSFDESEGDDNHDSDVSSAWEGPTQSNLGEMVLTREQLHYMADGTKFSNLGKLTIAADVPAELLVQKISRYENLGTTYGPAALLAVLQARCTENLGKFVPMDAPGADNDEGDE